MLYFGHAWRLLSTAVWRGPARGQPLGLFLHLIAGRNPQFQLRVGHSDLTSREKSLGPDKHLRRGLLSLN